MSVWRVGRQWGEECVKNVWRMVGQWGEWRVERVGVGPGFIIIVLACVDLGVASPTSPLITHITWESSVRKQSREVSQQSTRQQVKEPKR